MWVRNYLQTYHIKCEQGICQLSVTPGKKAKGVKRCGNIDRKDQGRPARLVYLYSGPLHFVHNWLNRTKIVTVFAYQHINTLLGLVSLFSWSFVLCA